jgi:hypothetical protein
MLNVVMLSVVYVSAANAQLMLNVVMLSVMAPLRIGKSDLEIQFYCISVCWHCWKCLQHCQCISGSVVSASKQYLAVQVALEVL